MCKLYQFIIMLLVFIIFGILCFIYDNSKNDINEDFNSINDTTT